MSPKRMKFSRRDALSTMALAAIASTAAMSCGSAKRRGGANDLGLEPWEGQLRELFNDQIHPAAVGLSMDSQSPARDPLLRVRTTNADVAARMKVQTVKMYSVGAKSTYVLNLQVVPPTFAKPKLDDTQFEISIKQDSQVFGMVQSLEEQLRGKQFIGFIRRFPGEEGPVLHWHLTADSESVAEVVHEAAVLDEIGGSEK
jgi:hypothetical protein